VEFGNENTAHFRLLWEGRQFEGLNLLRFERHLGLWEGKNHVNIFFAFFWLRFVDRRNSVVDPVTNIGLSTWTTCLIPRNMQDECTKFVVIKIRDTLNRPTKVENEGLKIT